MATVVTANMASTNPDAFIPSQADAQVDLPQVNAGMPAVAPLADQTAQDLVQLFKLLADETRVRILYFLMQQEELNVRTLCHLLAQSQPAVSHHLALLRAAGIIKCRRDGKHNFYHLVPKRFRTYLETLFASNGDQPKKIRIENTVLTFSQVEPAT